MMGAGSGGRGLGAERETTKWEHVTNINFIPTATDLLVPPLLLLWNYCHFCFYPCMCLEMYVCVVALKDFPSAVVGVCGVELK